MYQGLPSQPILYLLTNWLAQQTMDRKYGWSTINTPAVGIQALERDKRWSLLPVYTTDGYLPGYLIYQGSVTKID